MEDSSLHSFNLLIGNPLYCNCYMRPLKRWASAGGIKVLGACAGPPHLSDEPLKAVALLDLRCRSRGETLKDELEKDDESAQTPTAKPKLKVKCPADCDCDVSCSLLRYIIPILVIFINNTLNNF